MIPNFDWTMIIVNFSAIVVISLFMPFFLSIMAGETFKKNYKMSSKESYLVCCKVCLIFTIILLLPLSLIDYFKQKDFYDCEQQNKQMIYINKNYKCVDKDLAQKYVETMKEIIIKNK